MQTGRFAAFNIEVLLPLVLLECHGKLFIDSSHPVGSWWVIWNATHWPTKLSLQCPLSWGHHGKTPGPLMPPHLLVSARDVGRSL